ncbi:MAG: FMN-binding protein [Pseudomonadales bacterium]
MRIILGAIFDRVGRALVAAIALACAPGALAEAGVYQDPEAFIAEAFPGGAPDASALWLRADLRERVSEILGRAPGPRLRYWQRDGRTVWVLEEIGKDQPITAGVVVRDGAIEAVEVLVFRESRGWEVKYPFFTRQFRNARLTARRDLDQSIDGITGATLSVRAMTRMARVALLLDAHTRATVSDLATAR